MTYKVLRKLTLQALPHDSHASVMFDLLRGVAAIYVMIFHFREQLFVGAANMYHPGIIVKMSYLATSIGYEFVMAFFVLSGFLISSSVLKAMISNRWSWKTYLVNRVTRLWIVLIPALFMTFAIDKITAVSTGSASFYDSSMHASYFIGDLFFLQGIFVPIYGMNGPLWSLSYEFWYYILFPCIALVMFSSKRSHKILYALVAITVSIFLGKVIMLYFLVWLLGTLIVILPGFRIDAKRHQRLTTLAVSSFTVIMMVAGKYFEMIFHQTGLYATFPTELCVGITFAVLLYVLLHTGKSPLSSSTTAGLKISGLVSGFSYTLYLTHYPLILSLRNFVGYQHWSPNLLNSLKAIAVVVLILGYAWAISRITEVKTDKVRRLVFSVLGKKHSQAQQSHLSPSDSS